MASVREPRGRLFRKYVVLFVSLVSGALLTSGLLEIYFSYQENKAALGALQREKALAASTRIEQFIKEIERQVGWASQPQIGVRSTLEQRRFDYLRLLRQVPAVTEISLLDGAGREQLNVSRLAMDRVGSGIDVAREPKFREARPGTTWFGPVYFRKESEPYMTLSVAGRGDEAGVTVAEVNLKFIWDVVSQIKVGQVGRGGHAYVVDARCLLIAHPDISLVLQKTDMCSLPHVKATQAAAGRPAAEREEAIVARDLSGRQVLDGLRPHRAARLARVRGPSARRGVRAVDGLHQTDGHPHPARYRSCGTRQPPSRPADGHAHPRAPGRRRPDRSRRPRPADRRPDRRRAGGAGPAVQQHGRGAPRVLRRPGAEGRGADARPHRGPGAADGDGGDPAGHLQLADGHPAGARRGRRAVRPSSARPPMR